jgi:DNA-binding IclR family transcriptional regulator
LHAGCSRILLAYAPDSVRKQVLSLRLPRFTSATRTDPDWLVADMQRIRARGWLLTAEEVEAGAVSIAAPVRDASGLVIAVLFVAAPVLRMRPHRARSLLPIVLETAGRLSVALGADEQGEAEPQPTPGAPVVSGPGLLARQAG